MSADELEKWLQTDDSLAARLLPGAGSDPATAEPGRTLPTQPRWFRALTTLTRRAEGAFQASEQQSSS